MLLQVNPHLPRKKGLFPEVDTAIRRSPLERTEGTMKLQSAGWSTAFTAAPSVGRLAHLRLSEESSVAAKTTKASFQEPPRRTRREKLDLLASYAVLQFRREFLATT